MANPYNIWDTRTSLGVMRATKPENLIWLSFFANEFRADDEYIDFEKLPVETRKLAAFVLPMGRGVAIYDDSARTFRFKPAYVKTNDVVDPNKSIIKAAGIDAMLESGQKLSPMQRRELVKAAITASHIRAIRRTWNWLGAKALIDGKVTLTGPAYPTTLVDFGRAAGHTITLGAGARFGDAGVSIVDFVQSSMNTMNDAEFGGVPTQIRIGSDVWAVARKNAELLSHLDKNTDGGNIRIERGLVSSEKSFKVGEMLVGGQSGARIELWVDNETYRDAAGAQQRYLGAKEMVFLGTPESIFGIQCFGMIQDMDARFEALPIFPSNYTEGNQPKVEFIGHTSAPLMVPVNPDATLKATVVA